MARKRILCIDGGGIRGIIPLCALVEFEKQLGKPACEMFSFIAGTSTGAIISGALARGLSAETCLGIYLRLGSVAFKRLSPFDSVACGLSYQYYAKPLADLLRENLGDPKLNELPVDIMLTAMRVRDGRPFYFVRDNPLTLSQPDRYRTGELSLVDCITASAAAPTFFEPWNVPPIGVCVDGGVGIAGNPVYQACVEAFYYTPEGTYRPSETTVVSLGTGFYAETASAPSNLLQWVHWIVGELLDEPSAQQTQLVERHFVPRGLHLIRLNTQMAENISMDAVDAIPRLAEIGREAALKLKWQALLGKEDEASKDISPLPLLPRNRL